MDKLELAERIEKATGPDRELDETIACALHIAQNRNGFIYWMNEAGSTDVLWHHAIKFTASLDAAMTLVPEGWLPIIDAASEDDAVLVDLWARVTVAPHKPKRRHAKAATPALALCAAALRARDEGGKS
jgi:hypothetical protein